MSTHRIHTYTYTTLTAGWWEEREGASEEAVDNVEDALDAYACTCVCKCV
jgi:hypothetical protein